LVFSGRVGPAPSQQQQQEQIPPILLLYLPPTILLKSFNFPRKGNNSHALFYYSAIFTLILFYNCQYVYFDEDDFLNQFFVKKIKM
jgi:hypothetical protein